MDKRWKRNLELNTINISDHVIKISPSLNKRNKLYSLGKWVDTSPLCVNPDGSVSSLDLVVINPKAPEERYSDYIRSMRQLFYRVKSFKLLESAPTAILQLPAPELLSALPKPANLLALSKPAHV